jgi:HEAT repeat protein
MRWTRTLWLAAVLASSNGCATKSGKPAEDHDAQAAKRQALEDPALRGKVEALLTGYEYVPTAEDWKKLGPGVLPVLEAVFRDAKALPTTRMRAVSSMAFVEDPLAVTTLKTIAAETQTEARYRAKAVLALGQLGGAEAITSLSPVLESPDTTMREAAARALGQAGGPEARRILEGRLEQEEQAEVREAIQQSLTRLEP